MFAFIVFVSVFQYEAKRLAGKNVSEMTVFDILSLIFQKLKRSRDSDPTPSRDNLSSEGWDLL